MIGVAVGTFMNGFDELVAAADEAASILKLRGFAQIGDSSIEPENLDWFRFTTSEDLQERFRRSNVLICHAGMGLVGEGLRCGCRIVLFPRSGATTRKHPANDQTAFAKAIAERYHLSLCLNPAELAECVHQELERSSREARTAIPTSNVPPMISEFLASH